MKRVGAALVWTSIALLALIVSVAYHAQLRLAGVVIVEAATGALNREIGGELEIGAVETNGLGGHVRARDVVIRDPQGREVIRVERVRAQADLGALLDGTIRVSSAEAQGGEVTLYVSGEENETVSLVEAFLPANPSPVQGPEPPHILVDGIVLRDIVVRGDVPGWEGMRFEDVDLEGRIETVGRAVRFSVFDGDATMTGPYEGEAEVDRVVGRFSTDLENEGLRFFGRAHRGEDRVAAQIELTRPDVESPPVMDLHVRAEPIRISTLREMQIVDSGLEALEGTVHGRARLWGSTDDLQLSAHLRSEAGRVRVRGRLPREGTLHVEAETQRLELGELVPNAPPTVFAGSVAIDIDPPEEEGGPPTRGLRASASPLTIEDVAIPAFTLEGVLEDDALRITDLDADHAGGETVASGRIGFDGSLDVHVRSRLPDIGADPNVRRQAPGVHGSLFAELDLRAGPAAENLRGDGRIAMRGARFGSIRADRLDVRGHASGAMPAPTLRLEGEADDLQMGELALGRAHVTIRGGPEGYTIEAETAHEASGTRLSLSGRASSREDGIRLDTERLEIGVDGETWTGDVALRFDPGNLVDIDRAELANGNERVSARGTYRFRGDDQLDVTATNLHLEHLQPLSPELETVEGHADVSLEVRGDLDRRPQGRLSARIENGRYRGMRNIDGRINLSLEGDRLETDVSLELGGAGGLVAQGAVRVPPSAILDPERLLDEVAFDGLRVRADNVDIGPLFALAGVDEVEVSGRVTTSAELTGTARRPGVRDAVLVLDRIVYQDWQPLRAKLRLGLGEDRLIVRHLWLADSGGEIATAEADLPFALDAVPRDLPSMWRTLRTEEWALSARIAQRRLDDWPFPQAADMPRGLAASASITAGGDGQAMTADFEAVGRWVDAAVDDPCASGLRPLAIARGRLEDGVVLAEVSGFFGGERRDVQADVAAVLPLDEWVERGGVDEFPSTEIALRALGADMADIPWLCGYGRGPIYGRLTAKDLLTGNSVVGAVIDLPRFAIWGTTGDRGEARLSSEYRAHVRAGSSPERDALTACAILGSADTPGTPGALCREIEAPAEGELLGRLRVPVRWVPGSILPEYIEDQAITSWARFEHVHVEPVLTLIPGIVSGDAIMHGEVALDGPLEAMLLDGELDLSDGHLAIEGLGQHLFDISGRVEMREHDVLFPESRPLVARDQGGEATAWGSVRFEGLFPREFDLRLGASSFPIRNEGMVLASLTGRARMTGEITDDATTSRIVPSEFVVRLPEQSAAALQPLEPHSDILVVGSERPAAPGTGDGYPVHVTVDARTPFWIRRNDFSAQLTAELDARYEDENLYVGGHARIRRGVFEIFGKRFELQDGGYIAFDPTSETLDPAVNIAAIYEIPGRSGATVTVNVRGTLTQPEIVFSSTETNDRAEIIALLISGGRREAGAAEAQVSEQAASFLAGLTAGILTLGLRQEFGDVIPVLAIESEGASGTRLRLGINANDWIPDALREYVTGMYIEGFVSGAADGQNAAGSSSGGGGVGGGVTVELTFPYNLLVRGTYVPVDNGGVDLLWEPE